MTDASVVTVTVTQLTAGRYSAIRAAAEVNSSYKVPLLREDDDACFQSCLLTPFYSILNKTAQN